MEEADSKSIHVITGENVSGMSHNQIKNILSRDLPVKRKFCFSVVKVEFVTSLGLGPATSVRIRARVLQWASPVATISAKTNV